MSLTKKILSIIGITGIAPLVSYPALAQSGTGVSGPSTIPSPSDVRVNSGSPGAGTLGVPGSTLTPETPSLGIPSSTVTPSAPNLGVPGVSQTPGTSQIGVPGTTVTPGTTFTPGTTLTPGTTVTPTTPLNSPGLTNVPDVDSPGTTGVRTDVTEISPNNTIILPQQTPPGVAAPGQLVPGQLDPDRVVTDRVLPDASQPDTALPDGVRIAPTQGTVAPGAIAPGTTTGPLQQLPASGRVRYITPDGRVIVPSTVAGQQPLIQATPGQAVNVQPAQDATLTTPQPPATMFPRSQCAEGQVYLNLAELGGGACLSPSQGQNLNL